MNTVDPQRDSFTESGGPAGGARLNGWDLLLVLALSLAAFIVIGRLIDTPEMSVRFVIAMLAVQSAIPMLAVYVVLVRLRGLGWAEIGLRAVHPRWIRLAVLIALATLPAVALVNLVVQALAGLDFRNPQIDMLAPDGFTWLGLVGMLAMAGAVVPVVEEIVFRGLLHGWLRRWLGVAPAALLSAAAFAAAHGIVILMPALFLQGVVLALVYERSGSLWPAIVVHGTFNGVMVILLYGALAADVPVP